MKPDRDIHFFANRSGRRFCLDVGSSSVFGVDALSAEVLAVSPEIPDNEIRNRLAGRYPAPAVEQALDYIGDLRTRGFFVSRKGNGAKPAGHDSRPDLLGLSLFVANACNMHCKYCFNDGGTADHGSFMQPVVARQAVDFLLRNSTSTVGVDFFGGEPLLNFGLIRDTVAYCEGSGRVFQYSMITNGTLVDEEIADYFARHRFHIVVSYDGYLQDIQRPSCDGRSKRELVRQSVRVLAARLPREDISIRCVLTHGPRDYDLLAEEADELGVRLLFGPVTLPPENGMNLTREDFAGLRSFQERYLSAALDTGRYDCLTGVTSIVNTMMAVMRGKKKLYSCGLGRDTLAVSSDGVIYPCHRFVGMAGLAMGHVARGLDMAEYRRYDRLSVDKREKCSQCWARHFCGGGCAHDAYTYSGQMDMPAGSRCHLTRDEIELGLRLYVEAFESRPEYLQQLAQRTRQPGGSTGSIIALKGGEA